jgi:hypothetical protein
LQLGLLIGRDDVIAGMQPLALPAPLIEIQDATSLAANSGSRGNTHERHDHGRIASSDSHRHTVVPETSQTIPRWTACAAISVADHLEIGRPDSAGNSHASALTSAI